MDALLNKVRDLLQGEPLRFIVDGAAVVVWAVVLIANAIGFTKLGPTISLTDSLVQATAAGVLLSETARHYVFSPNTVAVVAAGAPVSTTPGAVPEAPPGDDAVAI